MNLSFIPSFPIPRWAIGKITFFALLGLLALDGGVCATNAFAGFQLSPSTLAFTAPVGTPTKTGSVTVTNTGSTPLTVTYEDAIFWLVSISPGLTQTIQPGQSGTFTLTASFAGLAAGSYSGTGTISGGGITKQVPVTLALTAATSSGTTGGGFSISPSTLDFTAPVGTPTKTGSVTVTNTGSTPLTVTYADAIFWLVAITPSSHSLTLQPGQAGTFTLTASFASLAAGSYSGTGTISGGGITKQVPVTLALTTATSSGATGGGFSISPPTLDFTAPVGTPTKTGSVTVTNTGSTPLTVTYADAIFWLVAITPSSHSLTLQPGQAGTFTLTASFAGLAAGSYSGTGTISGGGITKQVPVTLALTAATSSGAIGFSPTNLAFSGTVGGSNPAAKTVSITNTGGGTLPWTVSGNAAWLALSPTSGTNSGTVTSRVNLMGLATGTYNAIITVTAAGATTKTIPVTLTVSPAASTVGGFSISPSTLDFTAPVGTPTKTGSVTVTNTGSTPLTVTYADAIFWLVAITPSSHSLTLQPGQAGTFTLTASFAGLAAGSYNGTGTISGGGITKQVPVTLALTKGTAIPAIGLNTTSLGFTGTMGGTNPSAQTLAVSNVGGGTLTWSAGSSAPWLILSPLSGTNAGTITASVNQAGLLSGSYTTTVTVTAIGATAKTIPVALTITGSTSSGTIGFSPTNLAFSGTAGGANPAAKTFSISNTGGGALAWTVSGNAAWLALSPVSGSNSGTVTSSVNLTGLATGTYNAIITVTASGSTNSPRQIPVSLTLGASTTGNAGATVTWKANSDTDLAGYKVYQGTSSGTYTAPVVTLPKSTTSYAPTGLQTGTTYFFAVTAYDIAGNESTFSPEVSKSIY